MIPDFDSAGNLPAGIHRCTLGELRARFGTNARRVHLCEGLLDAAKALKIAGCKQMFIDGSFATQKDNPADFDGCWSVAGVDGTLLDPVLLDFSYGRFFQKLKYRGELFPADWQEANTGRTWLEFFQQDKDTGVPKGILEIHLDQENI